MATIRLVAMRHVFGGPDMPTEHQAMIRQDDWPTGGIAEVDVLVLYIGDSTIEVWPADKDYIHDLGKQLIKLSGK